MSRSVAPASCGWFKKHRLEADATIMQGTMTATGDWNLSATAEVAVQTRPDSQDCAGYPMEGRASARPGHAEACPSDLSLTADYQSIGCKPMPRTLRRRLGPG